MHDASLAPVDDVLCEIALGHAGLNRATTGKKRINKANYGNAAELRRGPECLEWEMVGAPDCS